MKRVKALCRPLLAALVFIGCSQWAQGQLIPLNFVYTGRAEQPIRLSLVTKENIYIETNRFLRSEPTPDLEGIQNAWDSISEFKARSGVDLK